jgi:phosphoribosylanthranilate isomerase
VILAGGPRLVSVPRAAEVFAPLRGTATRRVGVFGAQGVDEALEIADKLALDVIQFADGVANVRRIGLRERWAGALWQVAHTDPQSATAMADPAQWFASGADAIVLDAAVAGQLGGTGVALDWRALGPEVGRLRSFGRVVLAGGLRPENVARAVSLAAPDVVDVSSGVESAPGCKDHERMRAFAREACTHEV